MKKLDKLIEYGFYLLVFLLPWQTRWIIKAGQINNGYSEYLTISLYGVDILLVVLLLLFAFIKIKQLSDTKYQIPDTKYWWLIAGLELFVFISIFFAADKLLAVYHYGLFLLALGLFWLVVTANYSRIKLIYSFLAGIFLQACLGIYQFLSQSSFSNKWLGLALHNPTDLGTSVIETIGADDIGERWLRAYGSLDHPNILGGVLVIGIILLFFLLLKLNLDAEFSILSRNPNDKWLIVNCYLLTVIFLMALFFTFSRAAWLALIFGLAILFLGLLVKKNYKILKDIGAVILVSLFLLGILFSQYQNLVFTRLSSNSRLEMKSIDERVVSYQEAKEIIKNNWLFGVGMGNYVLAQEKLKPGDASWSYQPVHNTFLLLWGEIGLVGLLFFIFLISYLIKLNFAGWIKSPKAKDSLINLVLLFGVILIMIFDHWWWSLHFGVLFFWLVLGFIARESFTETN